MNCRVCSLLSWFLGVTDALRKRNNQECEYTLAKKRQASKKSVGLGPPMNAPSSGKEVNEISSSITNLATEAQNNGQPSPELTLPSHASSVDSNDTVQPGPHTQPSVADIHSSQSPMGEYSNDASWNFDLNLGGKLPPTGSVKNMLDFQEFSWPVLATDNDSNFGFDISFTADALGTANDENPVSRLEDGYPLDLNQLSQPIDLIEPPRDLAKILDLGDKVRSCG